MDDTRDVALEARASASSAHKRLDTINGQIARGATATENLRRDMGEGFAMVIRDTADARIELVEGLTEVKTTVRNALRVVTVLTGLLMAILAGVSVWLFTNYLPAHHQQPSRPPLAVTQQHAK